MEIRKLPAPNDSQGRVETGPVQFGDDWPGVFIRGDNSLYFAMQLRSLLNDYEKLPGRALSLEVHILRGLASDLASPKV